MASSKKQANAFIARVQHCAATQYGRDNLIITGEWVKGAGKGDHGKIKWSVNGTKSLIAGFRTADSGKHAEASQYRALRADYLSKLEN